MLFLIYFDTSPAPMLLIKVQIMTKRDFSIPDTCINLLVHESSSVYLHALSQTEDPRVHISIGEKIKRIIQ